MSLKKQKLSLTLLRYSVVPLIQQELTNQSFKPVPASKGQVLCFLSELPPDRRRVERDGDVFLIEPFTRTQDGSRDYLTGRLAKQDTIKIGKLTDKNVVVDDSTDDWIAIWLVFDINKQYIGAEVSTGKFGDIRKTISTVTKIISPFIEEEYGYTVKIEAVTQPQDFWDVIDSSQRIFEIKLSLVSPNILDADETAKDAIQKWQKIFNQTEVDVSLKNEQGNLKVDRAPKGIFARLINYISGGEGKWKVKSKARGGNKAVKSTTSEGAAKKIEVQIDISAQSAPTEAGDGPRPEAAALVTALAKTTEEVTASQESLRETIRQNET